MFVYLLYIYNIINISIYYIYTYLYLVIFIYTYPAAQLRFLSAILWISSMITTWARNWDSQTDKSLSWKVGFVFVGLGAARMQKFTKISLITNQPWIPDCLGMPLPQALRDNSPHWLWTKLSCQRLRLRTSQFFLGCHGKSHCVQSSECIERAMSMGQNNREKYKKTLAVIIYQLASPTSVRHVAGPSACSRTVSAQVHIPGCMSTGQFF